MLPCTFPAPWIWPTARLYTIFPPPLMKTLILFLMQLERLTIRSSSLLLTPSHPYQPSRQNQSQLPTQPPPLGLVHPNTPLHVIHTPALPHILHLQFLPFQSTLPLLRLMLYLSLMTPLSVILPLQPPDIRRPLPLPL